MQIMYQRPKDSICKGFSVGQGNINIESLVISDHIQTLSVPELVPENHYVVYLCEYFASIIY